jgi:hypothetical protein
VAAGTGIGTGFFTCAAAGFLGALWLTPRDQLGRFFSSLHAGLALGLLALALPFRPNPIRPLAEIPADMVAWLASTGTFLAAGLTLIFIAVLYLPQGRGGIGVVPGGRAGWFLLTAAMMAGLAVTALDGWSSAGNRTVAWWFGANALAAAALLGSVVVAMLLGHWYLVRVNLSESHLVRFAVIFGVAVGVRTALLGLGLIAYGAQVPGGLGRYIESVVIYRGVFFWPRVLLGLLAPAVLAVMSYQTARMKSTMSATGILYIAVIFVMIGELLARYLVVSGAGPM